MTKIVVNAQRWGSGEGSLKVSTNKNTTGSTIDLTQNILFADYEIDFDGSDITSFTIATTSKRAFVKSVTLYYNGNCGTSTEPELSVSSNSLSIEVPYNQSDATAAFTVTGANLENNVTVSVSGADFSVSPTSITADANGAVNAETITVTYNGTSTTPVTGTVTVTCGNLSETVTVTAQKELPPPASITVNPSTLTINDSGTGNTFTVEGSNLGSDNVGVTQTNNNFTPTLSATTGTTYDGGSYRGFTPAGGEVNGTVAMSYTGRELYANNTVTLGNNTGASATVAVNYIADLYIVTDNGVTGDWHFDGTFGVPMTYNNGIYSAAFTVNNPNTYILFARKTGEGVTWNTRYVFGPNSSGDWDLPSSGNGGGSIDLNDDDPIKIQGTGTYIVTIDANTGTFSIVKKTIGANDFILVTKTNDVTANDDYVLVYDEAYAMGTTLSSSNGGYYNNVTSGFTVDNNVVSLSDGYTVNVFTLLDAGDDKFFMQSENGNYIGVNGNNLIQSTSTPTADTYKWSITISNNSAVIQNASTNRYLAYNTTSPRYNTYQSITTNSAQQYASLYKRGTTQPRITVDPSSLEFVIPAGGTSQEKTVTVTETNTTGTTSVSITGTGAANYSATLENGTLTVTYNGTATQDNPDVATVTLTNGEASAEVAVTGYRLPITVSISPANGTFSGSTMSGITIESNVAGATLEYRVDGGQWMTYSEAFAVTAATVGQIVTVEARATYNGETSAIATATYERVAKSNTLFEKVTSDTQIKAGNKYILVYEGTPAALNSFLNTSGGTGASVAWHGENVIDVANTDAIQFTLSGNKDAAKFYYGDTYLGRSGNYLVNDETEWRITGDETDGYYLVNVVGSSSYMLRYNTSMTNPDKFRCYTNNTGDAVYLYVQGGTIEAPEITPATGTYYENQTVSISDETPGVTIHYTTNGTEPTASSPVYTGEFPVAYTAGATTTIKAIAIDEEDNASEVATVVYTWGTPAVTIHPDSRNTAASSINVTLTAAPAGGTIYYTTDGSTPSPENGTAYTGGFTVNIPNVGDAVTVKAVTVYNGISSPVATATYTHVDEVLDVHAPFFSPLQNHTYYGDQTLQIASTTPNADIYYEIVEVSGTTAPGAGDVEDPTHASTYYDGTPIEMTAGNSYYVKAIAYIGNYVSTVSEGWYVIEPFTQTGYVYQSLKDFNDNCPTGVEARFANPVQVVYHSTYTNNGEYAEYCYLRDNTDYACVYFGKRNTSDYTVFEMGDWLDGSQIAGTTNIWDRNFHIQLGTSSHSSVTGWPSQTIGWSEILPEEITNAVIIAGTADGDNSWGHYVHLRNTTLSNVQDYAEDDPKHTGLINDGTANAYYYDKFYRWSAGSCEYDNHTDQINCLGDYNQAFFTAKQDAGATFDVYGIVDYYRLYNPPFEICPIDFLWIYKPEISLESGTYYGSQQVTITATTPEWAAEGEVIYYKTDDMEDWAIYTGPITVNSDTHLQAYAEVPAHKSGSYGGANYNDYVSSVIVEATYDFQGVEDPTVTPESQVIEVEDGQTVEPVHVKVKDNNPMGSGAVTVYTINGVEYTLAAGDSIEFDVTTTTTVTAVSSLTIDGDELLSNTVTRTYEFIQDNGKTYDLLTANPVVGNIYVIVNKADKVGLSKTQNDANRASIGVKFTDDATKTVVKGNTDLEEFVLEAANAGRYYFRAVGTQDYLVVTTNDNPNLMTGAAGANAEAAATVNGNVTSGVDESYPATIAFSYDGMSRYLRYYAGGRTFTTYTSATTNQDIFLYGIEAPELLDPAIEPHTQVVQVSTGMESVSVTVTPNNDNPEGAVTYYTTDGSDPRTSATRIEWTAESGSFDVNTTTTVKAVTGMAFGDGMVWSNVVSETYTFVGVEPPIITPAGQTVPFGTTSFAVTVETNPQNLQADYDEVVTYYSINDNNPRENGTAINGNSVELDITTFPTTVYAVTKVTVDGESLWSVMVQQTYEQQAPDEWTLDRIESEGVQGNPYVVTNELLGVWAVVNAEKGINQLWAKDQPPYESIDKRPGKTDVQKDYVSSLLKYQTREWDESNWVVLDFNDENVTMSPETFVGAKIDARSIIGKLDDVKNYTIKLSANPKLTEDAAVAVAYPGYQPGYLSSATHQGSKYSLAYNTYVPANFMTENQNRIKDGKVVGAHAGVNAVDGFKNDSLYFMNPKVQEVARLWAVWRGGDEFTVYTTDHQSVNAWDIRGAVKVLSWDYNCLMIDGSDMKQYGEPGGLQQDEPYEFHAAVVKLNRRLGASASPSSDSPLSADYGIYPLDMSNGGNLTAVSELLGSKEIESVRYYNVVGVESAEPFEGVNIVVTRYTDGSISTIKVLK